MLDRNAILNRLRKYRTDLSGYGVLRIGLFGSAVRNEHKETSDIDILIDVDPAKGSFENFMATCNLLERIFEGKKVDVVTTNGLSPYIGPHILKEVIYA